MTQNLVYTEPPPVPADTPLRLYSNPICPFVQRVKLIIAAKDVKADIVDIHLQDKPQWYLDRINPQGKVPTVQHNGHLIRESLIGFDYVDEVFGGESAWPTDPYLKAVDRLFVNDFGNDFIPNYYKHYRDGVEESQTQAVVKFLRERIEDVLKKKGDNAFIGSLEGKASAADYLAWPWLERLEALVTLNPSFGQHVSKEKLPAFWDYVERMKQTKAVKKTSLPTEAHVAFVKSVKTGVHDYGTADVNNTGVTVYAGKKD